MSKKHLSPINLTQGTTLPASGVAGDVFYDTSTKLMYVHDGTTWSNPSVVSKDTSPTSPQAGDIWFNTTTGQLMAYLDGYWIEVGANGVGYNFTYGATAPTSPKVGDRWVDSETGIELTYVFDGNSYAWAELSGVGYTGDASATNSGLVNTTSQTFAGNKTFTGSVNVTGNEIILGSATSANWGSPNYIINGGFDWWQRGTSGNQTTAPSGTLLADRWWLDHNGTGSSYTFSRSEFTTTSGLPADMNPTTPYYMTYSTTAAGTGNTWRDILQRIEDVRTIAGKTVTVSFWVKSDAARTINLELRPSSGVVTSNYGVIYATTTWQKVSWTTTLPRVTTTVAANSSYALFLFFPGNSTFTFDIWGIQLEEGAVATPFRRAGGTLQGELAACQRYYQKLEFASAGSSIGVAASICTFTNNNSIATNIDLPVTMRAAPTFTTNINSITTSSVSGTTAIGAYKGSYIAGTWSYNLLRSMKSRIWFEVGGFSGTNVGTAGTIDIGSNVIFEMNSELA